MPQINFLLRHLQFDCIEDLAKSMSVNKNVHSIAATNETEIIELYDNASAR